METPILNLKANVGKMPFYMGEIIVDADAAAEGVILMDRKTFNIVGMSHITPSNVTVRFLVPRGYVEINGLLVGMFDNDLVFESVFVDGVKATLLDTNA